MIEFVYQIAEKIGYTHPLHPAVTHIPVGAIICGFFFMLLARITSRESFAATAYHLMVAAIVALPITAYLGYMDWQHFYKGAWLTPIKMKMGLAGFLLTVLIITVSRGKTASISGTKVVPFYLLSLITVIAIGYFGGELVYGSKVKKVEQMEQMSESTSIAAIGKKLFVQKCSFCHYSDSAETKIGPGLKGIFNDKKLPVSKKAVSEKNIRQQLVSPYKNMPSFKDLTEKEIDALIGYLKTL